MRFIADFMRFAFFGAFLPVAVLMYGYEAVETWWDVRPRL